MLVNHTGELTALMVAVFWALSAVSFEYAKQSAGSLPSI
jgi:hypothetical protein